VLGLGLSNDRPGRRSERGRRGDQGRVARLDAVEAEPSAAEIAKRSACFVHQKVHCRKIPIIGTGARRRDIDAEAAVEA